MPRRIPRFRNKLSRLISNREWNAREVEHQEQRIVEAIEKRHEVSPREHGRRIRLANTLRRNAINRYQRFGNQITTTATSRSHGITGLIRWIWAPRPIKVRWARQKTTKEPTPEPTKV